MGTSTGHQRAVTVSSCLLTYCADRDDLELLRQWRLVPVQDGRRVDGPAWRMDSSIAQSGAVRRGLNAGAGQLRSQGASLPVAAYGARKAFASDSNPATRD
jgi:hypothetical protein